MAIKAHFQILSRPPRLNLHNNLYTNPNLLSHKLLFNNQRQNLNHSISLLNLLQLHPLRINRQWVHKTRQHHRQALSAQLTLLLYKTSTSNNQSSLHQNQESQLRSGY